VVKHSGCRRTFTVATYVPSKRTGVPADAKMTGSHTPTTDLRRGGCHRHTQPLRSSRFCFLGYRAKWRPPHMPQHDLRRRHSGRFCKCKCNGRLICTSRFPSRIACVLLQHAPKLRGSGNSAAFVWPSRPGPDARSHMTAALVRPCWLRCHPCCDPCFSVSLGW
jgi:hypothetical protein